jgi:signal transduction histidine kinase
MIRPWQVWLAFVFCLLVALVAMASISWTVLKLDRAQEEAEERAALEENVRLALWRMDSTLTPMIAQENIRPYFAYAAFYPAEGPYSCMFLEQKPGERLVPSPLLVEPPPQVLVYFQFDPGGKLTSPQAPGEMKRDLALFACNAPEKLDVSAERLSKLQGFLTGDVLRRGLPPLKPESRAAAFNQSKVQLNRVPQARGAQAEEAQMLRNSNEAIARSQTYEQAALPQGNFSSVLPAALDVKEGVMKPLWIGDELVLARRVSLNKQEYLQGCWLDWPGLKKSLLESITDLLPAAGLERVKDEPAAKGARVLASLPVELLPGPVPVYPAPAPSVVRLSLLLAWACVALAVLAVAALLQGALSLSERRGAFVSAVTHELRTPLTTFRMYAEMLARNMVPDAEKRQRYLTTLCSEADRLSHLVENVLAYARIERGRAGSQVKSVTLREIAERVKERLKERAEQAGMELLLEAREEDLALSVNANISQVEQILFNLVDNACKYAAGAEKRTIHLSIGKEKRFLRWEVRDHGPGISRSDARRLFRPFSKSAGAAANSAPGVGLGLALSRRLARAMGGELLLDESEGNGARFVLKLAEEGLLRAAS